MADSNQTPDCNDEPKLTAEEWAYIEAAAEDTVHLLPRDGEA